MDPVTGLGLAAGVVQLIDFVYNLVRESYAFTRSSNNTVESAVNISELGKTNKKLCGRLIGILDASQPLDEDDVLLRDTVQVCSDRIAALQTRLQSITVTDRPDGSKSKWRKIKVVFKAHWNREELEVLVKDVEAAQAQLTTAFLTLIRRRQILQHDELFSCINRYGIQNATTISTAKKELLDSLCSQKTQIDRVEATVQDVHNRNQHDLKVMMGELKRITTAIFDDAMNTGIKISDAEGRRIVFSNRSEERIHRRCRDICDSLAFTGMDHRKIAVSDVAQNTCNWIFDDRKSPFARWLRSDEHLFCIYGKPGSGKSCLMKSLSEDERTRQALSRWRPSSSLIVVDHFFWYAGDSMQKSHAGLLRSLLHGIISLDPAVALGLCPQRWQGSERDLKRSWTRKELMSSLRNIQHLEDGKVFVMIDGLDEYYPHDQHDWLVDDLMALLDIPNLKLCVSSRPWPVFQQSFARKPSLRLEQFNNPDIRQFAWDQLKRASTTAASIGPQSVAALANEVASLADGIFLWVYLAVTALTERMRAGGRLLQLRKCLLDFPKDLEHYFTEMIYKRISSTWREGTETACVLKIAMLLAEHEQQQGLNAVVHRSFIYYWLVSESGALTDEDFAFKLPIKDLSIHEVEIMLAQTTAFLNSCVRDLLRVVHLGPGKHISNISVEFAHRTIYDFITTTKMRDAIEDQLTANVRSPQFLSDLCLARIKFIQDERSDNIPWLASFVNYMWVNEQCMASERTVLEIDRVAHCYCHELLSTDGSQKRIVSPVPALSFGFDDSEPGGDDLKFGALTGFNIRRAVGWLPDRSSRSHWGTILRISEKTLSNSETSRATDNIDTASSLDAEESKEADLDISNHPEDEEIKHYIIPILQSILRMIGFLTNRQRTSAAISMIETLVPFNSILMQELLHCILGISIRHPEFQFDAQFVDSQLVHTALKAGANANARTFAKEGLLRSAWHLFLRRWIRQAWPPDYAPGSKTVQALRQSLGEIDEKAWRIVKILLRYGASVEQYCCIAATYKCIPKNCEHTCCLYTVTEILEACVPSELRPELGQWLQPSKLDQSGSRRYRNPSNLVVFPSSSVAAKAREVVAQRRRLSGRPPPNSLLPAPQAPRYLVDADREEFSPQQTTDKKWKPVQSWSPSNIFELPWCSFDPKSEELPPRWTKSRRRGR